MKLLFGVKSCQQDFLCTSLLECVIYMKEQPLCSCSPLHPPTASLPKDTFRVFCNPRPNSTNTAYSSYIYYFPFPNRHSLPYTNMPLGFPAFRHDPTAPVNPVFLKKPRGSAAGSPPSYRDSPSERSLPRYTDKEEPNSNREKSFEKVKGMDAIFLW